MSSITDKIKGTADEVIGNVKQGIGHATGDKKLVVEGNAQKIKGHAEKAVGDVKSAAKDAVDAAADNTNRKL
jgi:uncharacterized protein YjbJ (UPF0337 family)